MKRILFSLYFLLLTLSSNAQITIPLGLTKAYHGLSEGYTLFAPLVGEDVYLINNCGELVHRWDTGTRLMGNAVYLTEEGNLLKTSRDNPLPPTAIGGGGGGQYAEFIDWEGNIIWQFEYFDSATVQMHHDVEMMPNGNVLILAWDRHEYNECVNSGRDPAFLPDGVIWGEHIIEVDPTTNQIVWEWWLWDHLVQDFDPNANNFGVVADHPELMDINFHGYSSEVGLDDWIHANSIDYNASLDQIVMNSRHTGEFYIIDHSTTSAEAAGHTGGNSGRGGDFIYRWGNPMAYGQGDSTDAKLFGAHNVHWMEESIEGPNKLLIFNNGWNRYDTLNWSDVMALDIPWNDQTGTYDYTPGVAFGPAEPYWSYEDTTNVLNHGTYFYSGYISGAQRIANGNTLICDGAYGRIFEITPANEVVWEYYSPVTDNSILNQGDPLQTFALGTNNPVFRALKYPWNYTGFDNAVFNNQGPIEGGSPVPYNCGGFANIEERQQEQIKVFPNPVSTLVTIEIESHWSGNAKLINGVGHVIKEVEIKAPETKLNVFDLESGMYYLKMEGIPAQKVHVLH